MKEYTYKFKCKMQTKDKNIDDYRGALQEEHASLLVRYRKLTKRVTSNKEEGEEYVLKRMQLKAMDDYIRCLEARMALVDVYFNHDNDSYFAKSGKIVEYEDE